MSVVVDTSALLAAARSPLGVSMAILLEVEVMRASVSSRYILEETILKLTGKRHNWTDDAARGWVRDRLGRAHIVTPAEVEPTACRDVNDLPVLGTALAGKAEVIVAYDRDLVDLKKWRGIQIMTPGQAMHQWRREIADLAEKHLTRSVPDDHDDE